MNLPDLPPAFLEVTRDALLEGFVLGGYPLWLLEDPDEVAAIVAGDDAFSGLRKYPPGILAAVSRTALEEVNRLAVAEDLRDEP